MKWYRKSATQGDSIAQINLGLMYLNARGVQKDDAQAAAWFRKAAEQGEKRAQYNLAELFEEGQGVQKDYVEAYAWFNLSAEKPGDMGTLRRNSLGGRMGSQQIAEAQRRTDELRSLIEAKQQLSGTSHFENVKSVSE